MDEEKITVATTSGTYQWSSVAQMFQNGHQNHFQREKNIYEVLALSNVMTNLLFLCSALLH